MTRKVDPRVIAQLITEDPNVPNAGLFREYAPARQKPNLVRYTLEPSSDNDGSTIVLYFDGQPSEEEVRNELVRNAGRLPLSVDTTDPFFQITEHPTPVSELANLRRYECYPTG